mmetsp:Transcript_107863/g.335332  ORF Transcript_107863/g.335332 Transcript_107863/m.335332 type:complete len:241 (+) Transcript_107863:721-1443(+)
MGCVAHQNAAVCPGQHRFPLRHGERPAGDLQHLQRPRGLPLRPPGHGAPHEHALVPRGALRLHAAGRHGQPPHRLLLRPDDQRLELRGPLLRALLLRRRPVPPDLRHRCAQLVCDRHVLLRLGLQLRRDVEVHRQVCAQKAQPRRLLPVDVPGLPGRHSRRHRGQHREVLDLLQRHGLPVPVHLRPSWGRTCHRRAGAPGDAHVGPPAEQRGAPAGSDTSRECPAGTRLLVGAPSIGGHE